MTYCVALRLEAGLVMLADTRTNAGVDNISTFRKLSVIEHPGDRVIGLMTAGNPALSQAAINMAPEPGDRVRGSDGRATLHPAPTLVPAAPPMRTAYFSR